VIIWSRPVVAPPGTPFCAVVEVGASVRTACGGRWEPSYEDEIRWRVAHGERCGGCVRQIDPRYPKPDNVHHGRALLDLPPLLTREEMKSALRHLRDDDDDEPDPDDASDPTWDGEGPRLARQRLERRGR
jgi:hypothetical protein